MAHLKLLRTLLFVPLAALACDLPDEGLAHRTGDDLDVVDDDDGAAVRPEGPDALGVVAPDPQEHGLLCVVCLLGGHHEVCGSDGEYYENACFAHCHHASVVAEGIYYVDGDGDGFGDASASGVVACAQPAGTAANDDDCDDGESASFPGNAEVCDQLDNDCDGGVDEGAAGGGTYWVDGDGDGYGGTSVPGVVSCEQPEGTAPNADDCDDEQGASFPGNPEICDGLDNDCNGVVDEGAANGQGEYYMLVGATTALPEVGKPGAAPYTRDCPCGSVAVGIEGRAVDYTGYANIAGLSVICERLDGDGTQGLRFSTAPVGTYPGGDAFHGECPAGQVLVSDTLGVSYNVNNPGAIPAVASIVLECAHIADVLAAQTTTDAVLGPYTNTSATVQASSPATSACPAGQVMRGIHGGSGDIVDQLGFSCQQLVLQ